MRGKETLIGLLLGLLALAGLFLLRPSPKPEADPEREQRHPVEQPREPQQADEPAPAQPAAAPISDPPPAEEPAPVAAVPAAEEIPLPELPPVQLPSVTGVTLRGTVTADQQPLGQVELVLLPPSNDKRKQRPPPLASTSTDALGNYRFLGLEGGTNLVLEVRTEAHVNQRATVQLPKSGELVRDFQLLPGSQLNGWVRDKAGRGLAGMLVEAAGKQNPNTVAVSQQDGSFQLNGLPLSGQYITARDPEGVFVSPGYQSVSVGAYDLLLVMLRAASLHGQVSDTAGRPLASVRIGIQAAKEYVPSRFTHSDSLGGFVFSSLQAGDYTLTAATPGYAELSASGIEVEEERETWLDVVLERGATLRGQVVDSFGDAVEGVAVVRVPSTMQSWGSKADSYVEENVRSLGPAVGSEEAEAPALPEQFLGLIFDHTGADGRFVLAGLGDGSHRLLALSDDFPTGRATVVVRDGSDPEPLLFELQSAGSVAGQIVDEMGRPVAGARVVASGSLRLGNEAISDASGHYQITRLGAGLTTITAYEAGGGPRKNQRSVSAEVEILLAEEASLDLRFSAGVEVRGRLVRGGQPQASTSILFNLVEATRASDEDLNRGTTTDEAGRFTLAHMEPGSYQVLVFSGGKETTVLSATIPAGSPVVELPDLVMPLTRLSGVVVDAASGEPLKSVGVGLRVAGSLEAAGGHWMDDLAGYSLTTPEGEFELIGMGSGSFSLQVRNQGYIPWWQDLQLLEGAELTGMRIALERGLSLQGSVLLPDGTPTPTRVIGRCLDDDAAAPALSVSGSFSADGSYQLAGLVPSRRYAIWAARPGFAPARVVVQPNADADLDLELGEACSLQLTVSENGQPVAGAQAWLFFPDGATAVPPGTDAWPTATSTSGTLQLEDLAAGNYRVFISTDSHQLERPVLVTQNQVTELHVDLGTTE